MYFTDDKTSAILELQGYLQEISSIAVYPSGSYDEQTRAAVKNFQASHGIEPHGITDYETFTAVYEQYLAKVTEDEGEYLWDGGIPLPITEGSYGEGVAHLNWIISELADNYGIWHSVKRTARFSRGSADAVQKLRRILGLRDGRNVDGELYRRMWSEHRTNNSLREI